MNIKNTEFVVFDVETTGDETTGVDPRAAAEEAGPETTAAGCAAEVEGASGGGATTEDSPEGVESTATALGVDTLTDELLPESISRFNRFKSPRNSDATW